MNKHAVGAPIKDAKNKIASNGLRPDQNDFIAEQAKYLEISAALLHRKIVDWYMISKASNENKKKGGNTNAKTNSRRQS